MYDKVPRPSLALSIQRGLVPLVNHSSWQTHIVYADEDALEVTRRSGMVSALALGSAGAWLALCGGPNPADNQAIEQVVANVPFEDARFACADASGVCSTLYSQVCFHG